MTYFRKKSIRLRRRATRRLRTLRRQLRKIDLSLAIEIDVIFLKLTFRVKRRAEWRGSKGDVPPGTFASFAPPRGKPPSPPSGSCRAGCGGRRPFGCAALIQAQKNR